MSDKPDQPNSIVGAVVVLLLDAAMVVLAFGAAIVWVNR